MGDGMSDRPHPHEMALAPEGHALRFGIFKDSVAWWNVVGSRPDVDGDNLWGYFSTYAEATEFVAQCLKDAAEDTDWCSGCGNLTLWDGEICRACSYEWGGGLSAFVTRRRD